MLFSKLLFYDVEDVIDISQTIKGNQKKHVIVAIYVINTRFECQQVSKGKHVSINIFTCYYKLQQYLKLNNLENAPILRLAHCL